MGTWTIFTRTMLLSKPLCSLKTREIFLSSICRLAVSDCAPQTSRVSSNLHSSSSMAVSRVPSPPPPEVNTPVAENWCYTQRLYRTMTPTLDDDNPSGVVGPSRQELAE
ncbi:hypothetical protein PV327_002117 [Microctonus hyperodae]|uniref:Protein roadkill n=1 Tax=Microctonus hyperodae TaxID=165561 RepID=A0AA39KNR1_MICHY|nr:hypothetical protein PV327_002117 [Microctonus hyperodae]